jgi:hypothetical protein
VTITGEQYVVDGENVGTRSDNVTGMTAQGTNAAWCVQATYTGGSETTVGYSDAAGLGDLGSTCSAAGVLVP